MIIISSFIKDLNVISFIEFFLICSISPFLIYFLPLIIFYHSYKKFDKDTVFKIDDNKYSYVNINKEISFFKEDIEKVFIYQSIPALNNRTIWLYWQQYFYVKIITIKEDIVLTSLVCDEIEKYLPEDKIERKSSHFSHYKPK
jgi:hypothetical protein